jgi:outer membrane protein TolC
MKKGIASMRNTLALATLIAVSMTVSGSCQLTIAQCRDKARQHYPLIGQSNVLGQLEHYTISNANRAYLPQVTLSGRASYQSDVTEISLPIPGVKGFTGSKDQYQAVAEVSQTIWDGGATRSQKKIARASSAVEQQRLEVDLYALNERVNQVFFGILLLAEQLNQNQTLQDELQTNNARVSAYIKNGVANQADLDAVKVEQLNAQQRRIELAATQRAYLAMLSALIGESVSESSQLTRPEVQTPADADRTIKRPELQFFDAQISLYDSRRSALLASNLPRIGAFFQGAYGRPGLNMLNNDFSPYWIGGVRASWSLGNLYTQKANVTKLRLNMKSAELQRETFLLNTTLKVTQQDIDIDKYRELIESDDDIIVLRTSIKKSAEAKVENGTMSVSDLLREINAENLAMQTRSLHQIQLLVSQYALVNTTNNQRTGL